MQILGISEEHDAGTAFIENNLILNASNEERYVGKKFYYGFPTRSLSWILQTTTHHTPLRVAVASRFHVSESLGSWLNMPWHFQVLEFLLSVTALDRLLWGTELGPFLLRMLSSVTNIFRKKRIIREIESRGELVQNLSFIDHHLCHAAAAYYTSGWQDCLVITQDASGDGYCSKVFVASKGRLKQVHQIPFFHSPGHYYEYVTLLSGFKIGREGKVTGLAALGDPSQTLPIFAELLSYDNKLNRFQNNGPYRSAAIRLLRKKLQPFSREDIAAGVQKNLEHVMSLYIKDMIRQFGKERSVKLAVAGGVFANVKLNQVISQLDEVNELFIYPHMGDGGLAVGAALAEYNSIEDRNARDQINHVYLGDTIYNDDIKTALATYMSSITVTKPKNLSNKIAQQLAKGFTVAIVQEEMEYGPRALGHRSILYQATDPTVNDWLNKKLNRSEFMPFAPIIKEKLISDYFIGWEKVKKSLPFMTVTLTCNDRCSKEAPAIVHKDRTARPQSISKKMQPFIYDVLTDYHRLTGLNILINTSFNMHESPIVRTAEDAVKTFLSGGLDYLVLNDRLISRNRLVKD